MANFFTRHKYWTAFGVVVVIAAVVGIGTKLSRLSQLQSIFMNFSSRRCSYEI